MKWKSRRWLLYKFPNFLSLTQSRFNFFLNLNGITNSERLHDTGATDHLCHSKSSLASLNSIKQIIMRVPNRASITTNFSGFINFNDSLYLHDVLYIPSFCTNLIYVSKLSSSLNCAFIFSASHCLIQGIHTLMKIGASRLHEGLYNLISPSISPICAPSPNINTCSLWHNRLGYPSYDTLV